MNADGASALIDRGIRLVGIDYLSVGDPNAHLVRDIVRRRLATSIPALAAVVAAGPLGAAPQTVGFALIILTQLAQTVQAGRSRENLSGSVVGAVAGSGGLPGLSLVVPSVRRFLRLPAPTPGALLLSAATAPAAALLAEWV